MKKHLLFVTPKWCDGLPDLGFNNDFQNLFNTIARFRPDYTIHTLHPDECALVYNSKIDDLIKRYIIANDISIVIYCLINGRDYNPSLQCMKDLKGIISQIIIWPDTGPVWGLQSMDEIGDAVDLHVSEDCPLGPYHDKHPKRKNYLSLWTPEDPSFFYYEPNKTIDVSFMGSINLYRDRISFLTELKDKIKIFISGGQRTSKLSSYQYASMIRQSKIGINFALSQTGVYWQAKGRIFEYIASGALLLDSKNPSTSTFFRPGIDYIEFETAQDIIEKVEFYLKNDDARIKIASSGYQRFNELWTAKHYWDTMLDRLDKKNET